jgi:hypothetical protein
LSGSTDKQDPAAAGKGRPTPTRKEAEAAARDRARTSLDKKAAQKVLREKRTESNRKMREGMKTGDARYLPARDQGPVKLYIRNWVDSRLTFTEFIVPVMIVVIVLGWTGGGNAKNPTTASSVAGYLQIATLLLIVVDVVYTRVRLTKSLKTQFPDETIPRFMFYAYSRMMAPRFMRQPKPQVRVGGAPR